MLEQGKLDRGVVEIVDTESLVPAAHLLRKIDAAVDFNHIYEMVAPRTAKITDGPVWIRSYCSKWF